MSEVRKSCSTCVHLVKEIESWEMPDIYWWECRMRPGLSNLKQFPFRHNTSCRLWEKRKQ